VSSIIVYSYYLNVDTILLAAFRGDADAGLYSAPYRLFLAVNVVAIFAAYALMPAARRVASGLSAEVPWRQVAHALAAYGLLVLAAAEAVGGAVIETIFGPEFTGLGDVLVLLCAGMPWYTLAYPLGYSTIADDDRRTYLYGAAVAGIVETVGSLSLIPVFGMTGAAAATAVSLVAGSVVWIRRVPSSWRPPADAIAHSSLWALVAFLVALDVAPGEMAALLTGAAGLVMGVRVWLRV
jgi:O-antigen/teichoic acid export membrane protein